MQRMLPRLWLALALGILSASCSQDATTPTDVSLSADRQGPGDGNSDRNNRGPVTYAVIGDVPYGNAALTSFPTLIATINGDPAVRRVIHVGDFKSGSTVCSDAWFNTIATDFTTFSDPLVYAIGDNEWTDCHRLNNGGYNPLERLAKVRQLFFPNPGYTLGQQVRIKAEDNYPENQRWMASDVVFSVLHIIGSNNGRAPWFGDRVSPAGETPAETAAREAEWAARDRANLRWLERTFEQAKEEHAKGVVLFFQADLWHPDDRAAGAVFTAHTRFVERLARLAGAYGRPVLLLSGDSHDYRVDVAVPWFSLYGVTPPANITQVIVDRSIEDDIDYLRLKIDPKSAAVFSWEQVMVPVI